MTRNVFGLELPDEISHDWEFVAHLVSGELREDGSIDFFLVMESGTQRYLATAGAKDDPGVVVAPDGLRRLANMTREVIERNESIVREPTTVHRGFLLSVHPVLGRRPRVAVILEPDSKRARTDDVDPRD